MNSKVGNLAKPAPQIWDSEAMPKQLNLDKLSDTGSPKDADVRRSQKTTFGFICVYSIWALSLLLGGCKGDNSTAVLIEQPVTARPIVAVVPVMDRSRHELSWNVSHELTAALRQRLDQHGTLYLLSEDQIYAMTRKPLHGRDPFGSETAWVKKGFPQNEFVAFFELVEHREIALGEESPAELNVSMRVRVFDLRGEAPKVVLEEIVEQSHHIPKQFTRNQFNQVPWGDEMFEISPLGIAHGKLCQELASRVEDYILLSCKGS